MVGNERWRREDKARAAPFLREWRDLLESAQDARLRAVLQLHKPVPGAVLTCCHCTETRNGEDAASKWPCATFRAIRNDV